MTLSQEIKKLDEYNAQIGEYFDEVYEEYGIDPIDRLAQIGKTVDDLLEEMLSGKSIDEVMLEWF